MPKINQGKLQNKYDRAIKHHMAGKLQKARQLYREILKHDSAHMESLHMLGLLTHQLGNNDGAIKMLNSALKQGSESAELLTNLGSVLEASGQIEAAINSYRKALKINPDFISAHNNLGNALTLLGNNEEAFKSYNRALDLNPNVALSQYNMGNFFNSDGEYDKAITHFRKALTLDPEYEKAAHNLAGLLVARGDNDEAIELFKRALKLNKNNAAARHMIDSLEGHTTDHPSKDYVIDLFDNVASDFDDQLVNKLGYKAPELIYQAVKKIADLQDNSLDIMDLGCGTGLCAPLFRASAMNLTGIDLSPNMLHKARSLNLYDELIEGDISTSLRQSDGRYDLILSADVFIYVGNLKSIFKASAQALKPGGLFAFSLEAEESQTDFRLCSTGRYAHSLSYIRNLANDNALEEMHIDEATLRMDKNKPIEGYIVILGHV